MFVREATTEDELEVRRILDGAMLETRALERRLSACDAFVAGDHGAGSADDHERVLGALVLEPLEEEGKRIDAIAVRRRHRDRGLGGELVRRALERERRLTARFDADVRPFYEALEFTIEPIGDDRFHGRLELSP